MTPSPRHDLCAGHHEREMDRVRRECGWGGGHGVQPRFNPFAVLAICCLGHLVPWPFAAMALVECGLGGCSERGHLPHSWWRL